MLLGAVIARHLNRFGKVFLTDKYRLDIPVIFLYLELGRKVADDPNVIIAKMDVTGNHPPRYFSYEGFPTIFWAGMNNKVTVC